MARKLKKILKRAAPLLAIAGLGRAFMNARNRRNQMNEFLATEGGDISKLANNIASSPKADLSKPVRMTSANVQKGLIEAPFAGAIKRIQAADPTGTAGDIMGEAAFFKDGGKVVKTGEEPKKRKKKQSIQIRGFGKARR
jgi:hypothetical protein